MHLDPIATPGNTQPAAGELPMQPGAAGSPARMAVLLYLAKHPLGATRDVLCEVTGLDDHDMGNVLRGLSACERIACDRPGINATWYVPAARAGMSRSKLDALRGDPSGMTGSYVLGMAPAGGPA